MVYTIQHKDYTVKSYPNGKTYIKSKLKQIIYDVEDVITFGDYKGMTVLQVLETNKSWFDWCINKGYIKYKPKR